MARCYIHSVRVVLVTVIILKIISCQNSNEHFIYKPSEKDQENSNVHIANGDSEANSNFPENRKDNDNTDNNSHDIANTEEPNETIGQPPVTNNKGTENVFALAIQNNCYAETTRGKHMSAQRATPSSSTSSSPSSSSCSVVSCILTVSSCVMLALVMKALML